MEVGGGVENRASIASSPRPSIAVSQSRATAGYFCQIESSLLEESKGVLGLKGFKFQSE